MIIAPRPALPWCDEFGVTDNVAQLLEFMDMAENNDGDPIYDFYSMAHWVLTSVKENT